MATSYNGWPAVKGMSVANGQLQPLIIAGEPFSPGVLAGDVHDVFEYVLTRVHNEVEPVVRPDWHQADDWGYSFRVNVNNPSQYSCHASATAVDYNATRHPNGKSGTWTAGQKARILQILADAGNVIRVLWGYDEMHFEVCVTPGSGKLQAVAARLRGGDRPTAPSPISGITWSDPVNAPLGSRVLDLGLRGTDVSFVQRYLGIQDDGDFGNGTKDRVKWYQGQRKLAVDGVVGRDTWAAMGVGAAAPAPAPAPARKTNEQLAAEVKAGAWGNGPERERRLRAAGYDYDAVQAIVNGRLSVAQVAAEVIAGKWGNGKQREARLRAAGYDYAAVRAEVNRRLG